MSKNKREHTNDHYFSSSPQCETNYGLIRTKFYDRNFEFITASSVFSKRHIDTGTQLLIESMILPETGSVLDIGCGYGAVGIVAAEIKPKLQVYMSDVNTRAVSLAKKNAERNRVFNTQVRCGNLYEPVKDLKFDCILLNPPISAGKGIVISIITEATKVMQPGAVFEMVTPTKICEEIFPALFTKTFGNCTIVSRESGFRVLLGKYTRKKVRT
ncbi:MAG: methyltransferase [Nitrososphaerota archaeon]|jgi:16S rRNA G1207 methylase RsmC|nr:methyltransferase [Nitrososphaerota archaeon]